MHSNETLIAEVEGRYPIPAPVDYPSNYDYVVRVVFVQGQRQGYIDARRDTSDDWERVAFHDPRVKDEYQ